MGGKRKLSVFRSHSEAVAQTSQTLWSCLRPARQINCIQFKSLIYLIRGATNTQSSSAALPSDDRLESPHIKFFLETL